MLCMNGVKAKPATVRCVLSVAEYQGVRIIGVAEALRMVAAKEGG